MASTAASIRHSQSYSGQLIGLIWLSILGALLVNVQPMFLGLLADGHGLNLVQIGQLGGAELAGAALASLTAPYWFRRLPLRLGAVFALSVCIIGNAVTAWVSDYHGLLALRFMVGLLGAGLIYSMVLGLIGRVAHPDRVLALVIVAQILSMAGAMLIIPEIMARWQLPGVCLALALVFVSGFFCLGQLPSRFKPEATASDLAGAAFYPLLMLLCMLLFCAAIGGTWAFMERIGSAIGLPLDSIGQALAVGGLIGGLGALLAALLDLRWGRLLPLLSGLTLALLSALGLSKASGYWDYFSFQLLFSFCWNLCLPYMMGAIARVDKQGRFMVLVPATQAGGYAIGASLSGLLIGEGAPAYAGVVSALVFLVCAALLIPAVIFYQRRFSVAAQA